MKKILYAAMVLTLFSILLISCQKENDVAAPQNNVSKIAVAKDHNLLPSRLNLPAEEGVSGRPKKNLPQPTPTPTPTPTTPLPTSSVVACLYFDFDGENVNGGFWNNGVPFYASPSTMTAEARAQAMYRVQLSFANYNVTVTDDVTVYNNAAVKQRIIVTPTSSWYPSGSGVAGLGTLFQSSDIPAFVFTDRLYENTKYIGDIMMHEAGHTVGLYHQSLYDQACYLLNSYRPSTIMGSPFDVPQAPWIYGTSTSCTTYQDDNAFLTQKLGLK